MTTHPRFEQLLLTDRPLTAEEAGDLGAHLTLCSECRELAEAWSEVRALLGERTLDEPAPGFLNRWRLRLNEAQRKREGRQLWLSFGLTFGGTAAVLALLSVSFLGSFTTLGTHAVKSAAELALTLEVGWGLAGALLRNLLGEGAPLIGAGLALALSTTFAGLAVIWLASLYRFSYLTITNGVTK